MCRILLCIGTVFNFILCILHWWSHISIHLFQLDFDPGERSLMSAGACGAFVHGLEDEFLEVRSAAVTSMCQLGTRCRSFATQCVDFLVDMFNDEIQSVRLVLPFKPFPPHAHRDNISQFLTPLQPECYQQPAAGECYHSAQRGSDGDSVGSVGGEYCVRVPDPYYAVSSPDPIPHILIPRPYTMHSHTQTPYHAVSCPN